MVTEYPAKPRLKSLELPGGMATSPLLGPDDHWTYAVMSFGFRMCTVVLPKSQLGKLV